MESQLFTNSNPAGETKLKSQLSLRLILSYRLSILNPFNWIHKNKSNEIDQVESQIFSSLKSKLDRYYVYIQNENLRIWTISANTKSPNIPIVLVHGFCDGSAMWVHNIDALSQNRPFYAFDLLGFGRSSRPSFSMDSITAEIQFITSIEDWRKALNIEKMILLGHSFGAYLAASYVLKYPERAKGLVLVDPWGFLEEPKAKPDTPTPLWITTLANVSHYLNPITVFRIGGQVGINLFKYLKPDFKLKFTGVLEDPDLIYKYLYLANSDEPTAMAEYFGYAKNPMIRRVVKIDNSIPIWFIYGSRSWIDQSAGFIAIYNRPESILTAVKLITGAGNYVHADKPHEFNEYLKYILGLIDEHEGINKEFKLASSREACQSSCSSFTNTNTKS